MTTDKRKAQQKKSSANYRAKMRAYVASLLETIEQLKIELQRYRD